MSSATTTPSSEAAVDGLVRQFTRGLEQHLPEPPWSWDTIFRLMADATLVLDRVAREHAPEADCKAGCAFCCAYTVVVSVPELAWAWAQVASLPERQQRAIERRIREAEADEAAQRLNPLERRTAPCPLLEGTPGDSRCSVYDSRPLRCRGWWTNDASACATRDDVEVCLEPFEAAHAMSTAIAKAVAAKQRTNGPDQMPLEFALSAVAADPSLLDRWLQGEDVFACIRCQ